LRTHSTSSEAGEHVLTEHHLREESELSQFVFERFLKWLDAGTESNGERYLEMRRRLVSYFDRRNRPAPNELADETLNRVARTLGESGVIATRPPARFCYTMARFVLLEDIRRELRHADLDEPRLKIDQQSVLTETEDVTLREHRLDQLDRCLDHLKPDQRALIVDYYRDTGRQKVECRREQARRLGISMNALAIRACRIRDALVTCLESRTAGPTKDSGPHRPIR
jgi:DNA-directed RNA polymerase specialized sigma24 family protein